MNMLDWYVWGACKTKVATDRATTDIELMAAFHIAAAELRAKDNVKKVTQAFVRRIRACIHAKGGRFEHRLSSSKDC